MKPIIKIFFLALFVIFTAFNYKTFQSHIFALHFVDEDENIIAGYYIGKGEKFYKDIFSHKQPLPAVISMAAQKIQKPNSLYLLIKRHREMVYFYSIIWSAVLIITFGLPGLLFSLVFEIIKQFQLGGMYLSESLVVFPLTFALGFIWKIFTGKNTKLSENIIFSLSLASIIFLQFTLIPLVIFILILLVVYKKINRKLFLLLFASHLLLFFCCLPFVDYRFYLENTFHALRSVYLGGSAAEGPLKMFYYSFLRPFAGIAEMKNSEFGTFTGVLSLGYLFSFVYLFFVKKNYRKALIITFLLLGLSSLRIVYPDKVLYSGFHSLPWLAAIIFVTVYQIIYGLRVTGYGLINNKMRFTLYALILIFALCTLRYGNFLIRDYYRPSDRETDWYVNYSRFYDYGQTIRILSTKGDKVMVLPAEQLIYWQSGLPHASRFLYVYLFVDPHYKKELYDYWKKNPPAFLYDEHNMGMFEKWWPDYARIKQNKNDTPLFVRKDKLKNLKDWHYNELTRLNFQLP